LPDKPLVSAPAAPPASVTAMLAGFSTRPPGSTSSNRTSNAVAAPVFEYVT